MRVGPIFAFHSQSLLPESPQATAAACHARQGQFLVIRTDSNIVNNRQIVEVAALVSAHSSHLITGNGELPPGALEKFWDRSQCRLKLWLSAMAHFQKHCDHVSPAEHTRLWNDLRPVLTEIFVSEVLTRVWGAILTSMDQARGSHRFEAVARNVLIGHLDARKRALQLMVSDPAVTLEQLRPIDTIRRRVERWTDLLLGHLVERYHVDDFAFNPERAREFGAQQLLQNPDQSRDQVWILMLIGLRTAFANEPAEPPHEVIQEELIASILASFPSAALESAGPFRSIVVQRLANRDRTQTSVAPQTPVIVHEQEVNFRKLRDRFAS